MGFSPWDMPIVSSTSNHSNFEYFLQYITPSIPTKLLSQKWINQTSNDVLEFLKNDMAEGFSLKDFWHSYAEWSAYGVAVPIILDNGDHVVQYYSPSLSALQIYTLGPLSSFRGLGKSLKKAKSNSGACNGDNEKRKLTMSLISNSRKSKSNSVAFEQHGSHRTMNQQGYLYCQYNEVLSPYDRVPLSQKIKELAQIYPGLIEFRSMDLSFDSWVSIAWYPIYQIPMVKNVKELSACFLTYHPLTFSCKGSTSITLEEDEKLKSISCLSGEDIKGKRLKGEQRGDVSLPPFAAVAYKIFGTLWMKPQTADEQRLFCHKTAASSWLKQVDFQHHDFNFFMSNQHLNA